MVFDQNKMKSGSLLEIKLFRSGMNGTDQCLTFIEQFILPGYFD